jgi:hypothetical protein
MEPVNNKSLLHFVFDQMGKLDRNEIDADVAKVQASLAKQANNALVYEIKRADVQMRLTEHNAIYKDGLKLREVESKNFDQTID